jgi:NAD(P)-dependent dehydrogenase (short-subunit alcohol dehydrogenase family)
VHAFAQAMIDQQTPGAIVNTGSKQGITCPPGDTAYNITKAGVKVLTEGLAYALRNVAGCRVTAHLLVPGSTFTGMTARGRTEKPPGAWTPEQVVHFMLAAMAAGDFYIICPDNDVTRDIDNRRILWAAEDIIRNRPALSRWHPDYADEFAEFLAVACALLTCMARRHPVAVAIEQHASEQARLPSFSAIAMLGGIARKLRLDCIP